MRGGAIGELRLVRAAFSYSLYDADNIRLRPEVEGGALMDVGCYCVQRLAAARRASRRASSASARIGETGTDWVFAGLMRFPGDVLAQFDCGTALPERDELEAIGSEGSLFLDDPWHCRKPGDRAAPRRRRRAHRARAASTRTASSWRTSSDAIRGEGEPLLGREDAARAGARDRGALPLGRLGRDAGGVAACVSSASLGGFQAISTPVRREALTNEAPRGSVSPSCGFVAQQGRGVQMRRTAQRLEGAPYRQALLVLVAAGIMALIGPGPGCGRHAAVHAAGLAAAAVNAPTVDSAAPYTPAVLSLIAQLEPTATPTLAQVQNLGTLLHDGASPDCHNVGPVGRPFGLDASGNVTGTTLAAAATAGATNIKVASVTPFSVGQTIWIDATSEAEQVTIAAVGTAGSGGTGLDLTTPLTKAHASGRPAYVSLTTPSISYICWTDAQGVLNTSGPNARGSTGPMTLMGLGATFDRSLGNAWGQTEGSESRAFMVTGMFGPQTDLDRLPNWGRNLTTTGEDPYLSHELVAAQINGMQGVGAMSQMKHFVVYNGQNQNANTDIGDQGAARAVPDAVRGRLRRRPRGRDDVLVPDLA